MTLKIDGSQGEGGGQIIRSSLALSMVTGKAFEIRNIRAGRKKPGLLRQHLTGVHAAREISGADVTGAELGSQQLTFAPGPVQTRGFRFSIGSAGSATLVAQTVLPALMMAENNSTIEIDGGTHNMAAPPFDYLSEVYLPLVQKMGPRFDPEIDRYGFYPRGGGLIRVKVQPSADLTPLQVLERTGTMRPTVTALVSQLPEDIGEREVRKICNKAGWPLKVGVVQNILNSPGPGNCVMVKLQYENVAELFTGFGKRGVKAEQVATNTWRQVNEYLKHSGPAGEYLTDQLLLPLAISSSQGHVNQFRTGQLSMHSRTHIEIIKLFLDVTIDTQELDNQNTEITLRPQLAQSKTG